MRGHFGSGSSFLDSEQVRLFIFSILFLVLIVATIAVGFIYARSSHAAVRTVVVEHPLEIENVDVLVPVSTIEAGEGLEPSMFRRERRPAIGVSNRAVRSFEEIRGTYARTKIDIDQPLSSDSITNVRPTNRMTRKIMDGYRAVAISVDARSSVEGWAQPGARVDVVWLSRLQGKPVVTVIIQNAEVLSAERTMDAKRVSVGATPSTATLLVNAVDAAKLQLAQSTGSLSLNLRGDSDSGKGGQLGFGSLTIDDLYPHTRQDSVKVTGPTVTVTDPNTGKRDRFVLAEDGHLEATMFGR